MSQTPAGYERDDGPLSNSDLEALRVSAASRLSSSILANRTSLFGDVDLPDSPSLLELESCAKKIFATEEEASRWLRQSHPLLDGDTPLNHAKSSSGALRVKDILLAIHYGGVV